MLTPQLAPRPQTTQRRVAVALAGGGPLGAFFAIGTLQALAEGIDGLDLTQLHAYVGVSSGSMLSAALANGLTPIDIGRLVISNESGDFAADPGIFLHPAYREFARRAGRLPAAGGSPWPRHCTTAAPSAPGTARRRSPSGPGPGGSGGFARVARRECHAWACPPGRFPRDGRRRTPRPWRS